MAYESKTYGKVTSETVSDWSNSQLVGLYNELAGKIGGINTVKKFSDKKTALRRVRELLGEMKMQKVVEEKSKAPAERAPLNLEAATDITHHRKGTKRGKMIALMQREGGASLGEITKATGWDEKTALLTMKLVNLNVGYGIHESEDGMFTVSGPVKGRKPFNYPSVDDPRPHRPGTKRAKVIDMLGSPEGTTVEEVMKATGWNEEQALEGIKLVHSYVGYGLREDDACRIYLV